MISSLHPMQVDSALASSRYPVMLAKMKPKRDRSQTSERMSEGETRNSEVEVQQARIGRMSLGEPGYGEDRQQSRAVVLKLNHNRKWLHVLYLDFIHLSVAPLRVQIEQNTIARLIRFARAAAIGFESRASLLLAHAHSPKHFRSRVLNFHNSSPHLFSLLTPYARYLGAIPAILSGNRRAYAY